MTKYLGRHLMVKGRYVDLILRGRKTTTIRMGIVRPRYKDIIIHGGGRPIAKATIIGVKYKKVRELSLEDALKDGFRSVNELLKELRRVYGDVEPDDTVTIIEFEVTRNLEDLDLSEPYMGLEPADIARLALRYLSDRLTPAERDILMDLVRTNSIRAVAYMRFGSIGERYKVRRVLRKAVKLLIEEGKLPGPDKRSDGYKYI